MLETRKILFLRLFQNFSPDDVITKSNTFRTSKMNEIFERENYQNQKHQNTFKQINFNNLRDLSYIHRKSKIKVSPTYEISENDY